jgi:uncharacterized protein (TIGR00730 family)
MHPLRTLCVFCSSSDAVAPEYFAVATELGAAMAARKITLIYGGGQVGLMGAVARAVHQHGGRVHGVIPAYLRTRELAYEASDELLVTPDLRARKAAMEERADAFVALPGGFGTLEEILEVLTLKQLGRHHKPIAFLNTNGFFDPLLAQFERLFAGQFAKPDYRAYYHVVSKVSDLFERLEAGEAAPVVAKWFEAPLASR